MTGRPYSALDELQQKAIDDLYEHDERLALLETGFGKTVAGLTAGEELRAAGVIKRPLVFAPLRVAQNTWPQERAEWAHLNDVPMVEWGGEPANWAPSLWRDSRQLYGRRRHAEQRLPKIEDVRKRREIEHTLEHLLKNEREVNRSIQKTMPPEAWHVTSFENIEWLTDLYAPGESPFDLWIVDETGRVARNPKSPRYKALRKHMPHAKIRWGFNATPAPEGAEDLFGQVQLVAGRRLWGSSFYSWRQKFFTPADYQGYTWRLQLGAFDLLMNDLNSVAFRVPAEKLAYQKNITHRQIMVDLPPVARGAYDEMEKTMAVELAALGLPDGDPIVAMSEAAASTKLRQIVQGYLYEVDDKGRRTVHILHDEKTQAIAELIDSMGREPLLIAYAFDQDLDNLRKIWKGIPYLGQGVSSAVASDHIAKWNKRELPVLAIHPNCLHPDTLVLTEEAGWKKLIDVRADERVFDGIEFVTHSGCQMSGVRPVIERFGIVMTPDHRVLVNDEWIKAEDVRDIGSVRRAARYHYAGAEGRVSALFELRESGGDAPSERGKGQQNQTILLPVLHKRDLPLYDQLAPVSHLARPAGPDREPRKPELQALRRAWNHGRSKLATVSEFLGRHAGRLFGRPDNRAHQCERQLLQGELLLGYEYGAAGQQAQQSDRGIQGPADALLRILSRRGRDERWDQVLSQPVRNRRRGDGSVLEIDLPEMASQPEGLQVSQKVYDLVDCGPRHQFVVRNDAGEAFIVHNSASHGLNLQYGGHHIAWLALPWSLDAFKQSCERIDRRGQTKACYSHHILARDTIDQKVSDVLVQKNADQNLIIHAIRSL
jgi:hypothetical protein